MTHTRSTKRWLATAGVLAVVLTLAAACGDDNENSGSGSHGNAGSGIDQTTTTQDPCAQAEDLQNSITDLSDVDVSEEGTNALDAAVDRIEQNATDLASAVGDEVQPEVDDLKSSLSSMKDAIGNVDEEGGAGALVDALQEVLTSAEALIDKITSADC
jgi:hypothetical protein